MSEAFRLKLSNYHVATEIEPSSTQRSRGAVIIFSTRSGELARMGRAAWKALQRQEFSSLPRGFLADLCDMEILVPDDENELDTILARNRAAQLDDDTLYLVIQPTASCQLGCGYCGQKHFNKLLSAPDQDSLVERAQRNLSKRKVTHFEVAWFGAEPLSGLSIIRALTPRLQAAANAAGARFSSKLVTNGLALVPKVLSELVEALAVKKIEITLDGTAEYHDQRRMMKSGRPTFERIYANVVSAARLAPPNIAISIRCNVDGSNADSVSPLMRRLAADGLHDRVSFYAAYVHSWGNDAHLSALPPEEFARREIVWFAEQLELGFSPTLLPHRRAITCMVFRPEAELVDATGTLFNCTEVSYVPAYGTPNVYRIGSLSKGEITGARHRLEQYVDGVMRGDYECTTCRMLPVCGGSCPKQWLEGLKPCPSAKFNIEKRIGLVASELGLARKAILAADARDAYTES